MRRMRTWLQNLALAGIGVGLALVLAEGFLRLAWTEPPATATTAEPPAGLEEIRGMQAVLRPNVRAIHKGVLFETNSAGFRDREYRKQKPPGTTRIVVVGDSFTMAQGVAIEHSYANRLGKGTHRAIDRLQGFARRHRYVLRADIVQHFASIDHAILLAILARQIPEPDVMALARTIVESGRGVLDDEYRPVFFEGDDLLAACRPRGLPIGNLTSQFWSNCYLHPFDLFVKRELGCHAYLRYVDDFALFSDSKRQLWAWKCAIIERLARLRLVIHDSRAQVVPVDAGIPWLGFLVHPTHRLVKARKVRAASRRLRSRLDDYHAGRISFADLDASLQGWINHVRHADSWGLRGHVLERLPIRPAEHRRAVARRRWRA